MWEHRKLGPAPGERTVREIMVEAWSMLQSRVEAEAHPPASRGRLVQDTVATIERLSALSQCT